MDNDATANEPEAANPAPLITYLGSRKKLNTISDATPAKLDTITGQYFPMPV